MDFAGCTYLFSPKVRTKFHVEYINCKNFGQNIFGPFCPLISVFVPKSQGSVKNKDSLYFNLRYLVKLCSLSLSKHILYIREKKSDGKLFTPLL